MTDSPRPIRPARNNETRTTGDILILTIVMAVFLCVVVIGVVMLWDVVNPREWTSDGWSAVGSWVASIGTVLAVGVALWQSHRARTDAAYALSETRRQHEEQLRHEVWRSDLDATVSLLSPLTQLRSEMFGADTAVDSYRQMLDDFAAGRYPEPDEGPTFWHRQHDAIFGYLTPVKETYIAVRAVGLKVRSPDLSAALEEAGDLIELIGDQLHAWSVQAGKGEEFQPELDRIQQLNLDRSRGVGPLPALAQRAESVLREAAKRSNAVDLWTSGHNPDATMTS